MPARQGTARRHANPAPGAGSAPVPPAVQAMARRLAALPKARDRATPLGDLVEAIARGSSRDERRLGAAIDAWHTHVPPELAERTRLDAIRGSTLYVAVESSVTLYALDRLLRGGVGAEVISDAGPPVRQIRLAIGPVESQSARRDVTPARDEATRAGRSARRRG